MNFEKALIFDSSAPLTKLISKMFITKKREAVILDKGKLLGVIHASDISKRKVNDPHKIKISKFVKKKVKIHSPDTDLRIIIKSILTKNYKFALVKKDKNFFFLTKLNLIRFFSGEKIFQQKKAKDIMRSPFCVDMEDSISTGMSLFRELKISVLPVLNLQSSAEGFVDAVDLLKAETDRKRVRKGEKVGENIKLREVLVSSLMRKNFPRSRPEASISELIELMDKKTPFVFVERNGKLSGIVTPSDILRLFMENESEPQKAEGRVYFSISGIEGEDIFIKKVLGEEIGNEIRKLAKMTPIESAIFHVNRYNTTGKRTKYSVKSRILTRRGDFFAEDYSWDLTKAVKGVLHKLEMEIIRKERKSRVYRRSP